MNIKKILLSVAMVGALTSTASATAQQRSAAYLASLDDAAARVFVTAVKPGIMVAPAGDKDAIDATAADVDTAVQSVRGKLEFSASRDVLHDAGVRAAVVGQVDVADAAVPIDGAARVVIAGGRPNEAAEIDWRVGQALAADADAPEWRDDYVVAGLRRFVVPALAQIAGDTDGGGALAAIGTYGAQPWGATYDAIHPLVAGDAVVQRLVRIFQADSLAEILTEIYGA